MIPKELLNITVLSLIKTVLLIEVCILGWMILDYIVRTWL